jgi:hypothetical protein
MSHVIAGRLQARCAPDVVVPVADQTVLLYWVPRGEEIRFALRTHEEARGREYLLLIQGRTDAQGRFRLDFRDPTLLGQRGSLRNYDGEDVVLEIVLRGTTPSREAVQAVLGRVSPVWRQAGDLAIANLEIEVPEREWNRVRDALDEWTVAGTVRTTEGAPAAGYRVTVHDCDALHDDVIGSALVSDDGTFRIDYRSADFRPGTVAGIDPERGGPDLYFQVQAPDGTVASEEPSSRGMQRDRANAATWFSVDLTVPHMPSAPVPVPPAPRSDRER